MAVSSSSGRRLRCSPRASTSVCSALCMRSVCTSLTIVEIGDIGVVKSRRCLLRFVSFCPCPNLSRPAGRMVSAPVVPVKRKRERPAAPAPAPAASASSTSAAAASTSKAAAPPTPPTWSELLSSLQGSKGEAAAVQGEQQQRWSTHGWRLAVPPADNPTAPQPSTSSRAF